MLVLPLWGVSIPNPRHGQNEAGRAGIVLDLLAQGVDVPLETIERSCLLTPDAVEGLAMADHTIAVLAELSK